jgi:hypothetical protein
MVSTSYRSLLEQWLPSSLSYIFFQYYEEYGWNSKLDVIFLYILLPEQSLQLNLPLSSKETKMVFILP